MTTDWTFRIFNMNYGLFLATDVTRPRRNRENSVDTTWESLPYHHPRPQRYDRQEMFLNKLVCCNNCMSNMKRCPHIYLDEVQSQFVQAVPLPPFFFFFFFFFY